MLQWNILGMINHSQKNERNFLNPQLAGFILCNCNYMFTFFAARTNPNSLKQNESRRQMLTCSQTHV